VTGANSEQPIHPATPTIEFAQAVFSNWGEGELPYCRPGYRVGLGTWALLDERTQVDLEGWLQLGSTTNAGTKYVFGALRDDRLLFAKITALSGLDDFGRPNAKFWAHALITSEEPPKSLSAASPISWWNKLPFFVTLEAAVSAVLDDEGSLPGIGWTPPPSKPASLSGMSEVVEFAWRRAYIGAVVPKSLWRVADDNATWQLIGEAYRAIEPSRWGLLGVDTAFDGVNADPKLRSYWVVGSQSLERSSDAIQLPPSQPNQSSLDPVGRWVVALTRSGRWSEALSGLDSARRACAFINERSPAPGWTKDVPQGLLAEARPEIVSAIQEDLLAAGVTQVEANCAIAELGLIPVGELAELWAIRRANGRLSELALEGLLRSRRGTRASVSLSDTSGASPIFVMWVGLSQAHPPRSRDIPRELGEALASLSHELYVRWVEWVLSGNPGNLPNSCLPGFVLPSMSRSRQQEWAQGVIATWRMVKMHIDPNELDSLRGRWIEYLDKMKNPQASWCAQILRDETPEGDSGTNFVSRMSKQAKKYVPIPSWGRLKQRGEPGLEDE
jgi:hypothetical protein